jgi:hypothetical protein
MSLQVIKRKAALSPTVNGLILASSHLDSLDSVQDSDAEIKVAINYATVNEEAS